MVLKRANIFACLACTVVRSVSLSWGDAVEPPTLISPGRLALFPEDDGVEDPVSRHWSIFSSSASSSSGIFFRLACDKGCNSKVALGEYTRYFQRTS